MRKTLLATVLAISVIFPATAAPTPMLLDDFGAWQAYTYDEDGAKVCFMSTQPEKQESSVATAKRGKAYVYVTHRAGEDSKNVITVSAGYPFDKQKGATLKVDGQSYTLFADGERAWAQGQSADDAIASAIQKGKALVVTGTSARGTETTDTYSLKGSGEAYKAITKACTK